jgi:hypothetical protein
MDPLAAFLHDVESAPCWRALAPWLHIGKPHPPDSPSPLAERGPGAEVFGDPVAHSHPARESFPRGATAHDPLAEKTPRHNRHRPWPASGYLELDAILDHAAALALARAVTALRARAFHPTFLYVYDEAWHVFDALRPRLAPFLGDDLDVLADVWAWYIDPRTNPGGWPLHRGVYEDVRDATGTPGIVNVWVALTDASERNACMHLVPLPRDPHYPGDLPNLSSLEELGVALPTPAGSVIAWNGNVAHWGGTCDPTFDRPRISMSFTVRRRSEIMPDIPCVSVRMPFRDRLDVIAEQFVTYGDKELNKDRNEMRWASMVTEMRTAARRSAASKR